MEEKVVKLEKKRDDLEKGIDESEKNNDELEKKVDLLEKNNDDLEKTVDNLEKEIEELKSEKDSTSSVTSGGCAAVKVGTKVILYRQIVFLVFCMSKTYDFSPFFLFFICNI